MKFKVHIVMGREECRQQDEKPVRVFGDTEESAPYPENENEAACLDKQINSEGQLPVCHSKGMNEDCVRGRKEILADLVVAILKDVI